MECKIEKLFCAIFFSGEDHDDHDDEVKDVKEPKQELKNHLNGLYNGLTKIMKSTSDSKGETKTSPFIIEKAVHNIMFIKHHMKAQDEFDAVSNFQIVLFC